MANQLSKTGIADSSTIYARHITQSIDALTGVAAYDLTISGSLNLTGSFVTGSLTGSLLGTASYALNSGGGATASVALNISASYEANGGGFTDGQFKIYMGSIPANTTYNSLTSSFNSNFTGKTIGTNMFVLVTGLLQNDIPYKELIAVPTPYISASKINFNHPLIVGEVDIVKAVTDINYIAYVLQ